MVVCRGNNTKEGIYVKDNMDIYELFIEIAQKHGVPLLTKDFKGKTISYIYERFLVFDDNTCVYLSNGYFVTDIDDFHPTGYFEEWKGKFREAFSEFRKRTGWSHRDDLIDYIYSLPNKLSIEETLQQLNKHFEDLN